MGNGDLNMIKRKYIALLLLGLCDSIHSHDRKGMNEDWCKYLKRLAINSSGGKRPSDLAVPMTAATIFALVCLEKEKLEELKQDFKKEVVLWEDAARETKHIVDSKVSSIDPIFLHKLEDAASRANND